jgi:hypothetical protein
MNTSKAMPPRPYQTLRRKNTRNQQAVIIEVPASPIDPSNDASSTPAPDDASTATDTSSTNATSTAQ